MYAVSTEFDRGINETVAHGHTSTKFMLVLETIFLNSRFCLFLFTFTQINSSMSLEVVHDFCQQFKTIPSMKLEENKEEYTTEKKNEEEKESDHS